jgi:NADH-quinone oxidoreductase subunit L
MNSMLQYFLALPLAGFLISLAIPGKKENLLSWVVFFTVGIHLLGAVFFSVWWLYSGHPALDFKDLMLLRGSGFEFNIVLYFDKITLVYLLVGAALTFLVAVYSRYYMHRENGYKRFFTTVLMFYAGYNIIIFSGNLGTLFIGWEIMGITSFLLIAFYRGRYLPVKNAVKVFSIYRIGDIGIFLAMWLLHHLFHNNVSFETMNKFHFVNGHSQDHAFVAVCISFAILLSASAKSAQLPFSSWLPRAMEGPTPSSAIFYGSLSVHLGVFILLRTFPFWEHQPVVKITIGVLGFATAIVNTSIARVQSSIKTKIAYSSITQIGIIFIEMSLGFETIALIHFAGNAFLRTYQLLVSPSVVTYLIREQFYNFSPPAEPKSFLPKKLTNTFYMLSIKEWNLGTIMNKFYWNPLKWAGNHLNFLSGKWVFIFFSPLLIVGIICIGIQDRLPAIVHHYLPTAFSLIGLLVLLKSFIERKSAMMSWYLIIMNHLWLALAVSFNEHFTYDAALFYLSGVIVCGVAGFLVLQKLKADEKNISLDRFRGHVYEHPVLAFIFLVSCLGLQGFPVTPTFIGEEIVFNHIYKDQVLMAFFTSLSFIVVGLSVIRLYARIFLGPHVKTYHEIAYRSS